MSRFQAGGTVRRDSLYIKRSADQDLPQALLHGQLCYVLAPRQMGKSSLSARVEETLRQDGVRCATLDLIPFASAETTQEEWYSSLIVELGGQLLLADPLQQWKRLEGRAPALRWFHFLRDEVIARIAERVVIFIDEIDAILNLPPWRSDFLIGIQSLYNARHRDPACQRLTFCLSGVARPLDLSADPAKAAFTIGRRVELEDFTRAEMSGLAIGFDAEPARAREVLDQVYAWTNGHPYMTQRVCEQLANEPDLRSIDPRAVVDRAVRELFLDHGRREDANLAPIEANFSKQRFSAEKGALLDIYRAALGPTGVDFDDRDPDHQALMLTGLVARKREAGAVRLRARNRILASVFDRAWLEQKQMDREMGIAAERWISSGRSEACLLRGEQLERARSWAIGRHDVTDDERDFILASFAPSRPQIDPRDQFVRRLRALKEENDLVRSHLGTYIRALEELLGATRTWRWSAAAMGGAAVLLLAALLAAWIERDAAIGAKSAAEAKMRAVTEELEKKLRGSE